MWISLWLWSLLTPDALAATGDTGWWNDTSDTGTPGTGPTTTLPPETGGTGAGTGGSGGSGTSTDGDADTDADSDADTDADTDADSDADSDADTDTDTGTSDEDKGGCGCDVPGAPAGAALCIGLVAALVSRRREEEK